MRQLSRHFFPQKRAFQKIKNFLIDQGQYKWKCRREGGSSMSLCKSSVISHFQEVLSFWVTKTFQSKGQIFSLPLSFKFECRVDFNMAESTSSDNRPPSGYEEDFVEEVEEDFKCPICHLPLKEPVLTRCGHRYCKECLDEHIGRYEFIISSFQDRCSFIHVISSP